MSFTTLDYLEMLRDKNTWAIFEQFIRERPGLDPVNYGGGAEGYRTYRAELARIGRQRFRALYALSLSRLSGWYPAILADCLERMYAGRLDVAYTPEDGAHLVYTAGQYYPTEYRQAAYVVLSAYVKRVKDARANFR